MPFVCPNCKQPQLTIRHSIDLPGDVRWDDISVQTVVCGACRFTGAAVYQASRRGGLDDEIVHHTGYAMDRGDFTLWDGLLATCPSPQKVSCTCDAHRAFNSRRKHIWELPGVIATGKSFVMELK